MRILFTRNETYQNEYLADSVFHGLRELGCEVTDEPPLWYMYRDGRGGPGRFKSHTELHGRGFTLYRLVDEDTSVDRTDIEGKIYSLYYDICIIARADFSSPYEQMILNTYPANRVIILDGRDQQDFDYYRNTRHLIGRGVYFKRELVDSNPIVRPISFAFPKEKVIGASTKVKPIAGVTVAVKGESPYTYTNELDYYQEYSRSLFGETWKKGGWDCLRHYEIMAAGSVPWFKDIAKCPEQTCTTLPKEELLAVCGLIKEHGVDWFETNTGREVYQELQDRIYKHFLANCTTEQLAKYVLDTHKQITT